MLPLFLLFAQVRGPADVPGDPWSGAGSNRRPSAFQVNASERCANLRIPRSLMSDTALGGMCEER